MTTQETLGTLRGVWWYDGQNSVVAIVIPPVTSKKALPLQIKNQFVIVHENKAIKAEQEFVYSVTINISETTHYLTVSYNGETVILPRVNSPCPLEIKDLFGKRWTFSTKDIGDGYVWFIKKAVEQIDGVAANL